MRSKKYLMYGILVVLVISIGVSYSYFVSKVENKNGKLSINSKEINIIFTDTTEISEESITPGWSTSKSFSVENKSGDTFNYNIVLEDLINTFETVGNLQYKITSTNGYNMDSYADIPKSKESKDVILVYDIDIEASVKQEYTIEFIYKNSTEDQSIDMNKELSGVLAITEGSIDPSKYYSVEINLENGIITSANPQESLKKGSLTYTYELNEGYEINGTEVICSGSAKGEITEDNIIIKDIREDQVCTIIPSKKKYTLSIGTNDINMGTVSPSSLVIEHGGSVSIALNPKTGYRYKSNTCEGTVSGNTMTISNITANKSCTVTFERIIYTLTLIVNNGTYSGNTTVNHGSSPTYTIIPNVGYKLDGALVSGEGCSLNGSTLIVSNVISDRSCSINITTVDYTNSKYFYGKLLSDNPTHIGQRPGAFSSVYTTNNVGVMYVASGNQTEDGSTVYYFAGNAKNNWVKFGKDSTGADLYWRIIRTNEDGSVRMLYSGTSPDTIEGYIGLSTYNYNTTWRIPNGSGYMYGDSGSLINNRKNTYNSNVKYLIDNWYARGLNTKTDSKGNKFDAYVSQTAIYCNDRANVGYSTKNNFFYAARYRIESSKIPSYKCGNNVNGNLFDNSDSADKFSKNILKGGNGALKYPVALMTADEISFAGGVWNTQAQGWYYYNSSSASITGVKDWWTMTPYEFDIPSVNGSDVNMFVVRGSYFRGEFDSCNLPAELSIRPVISIKSCATWKSGNGASSTPYEVEIDSVCASAVN